MPLRDYLPVEPHPGCVLCAPGLERLEPLNAAPLATCPQCGVPVQRALSAVAVHRGQSALLGEKKLESRGFTQYRRQGKGKYEKVVGTGPDFISR